LAVDLLDFGVDELVGVEGVAGDEGPQGGDQLLGAADVLDRGVGLVGEPDQRRRHDLHLALLLVLELHLHPRLGALGLAVVARQDVGDPRLLPGGRQDELVRLHIAWKRIGSQK
jgi:hypothetical protein